MRVLIVEDDLALGLFLQNGLRREGHEVEIACDGRTGLDHVVQHAPDLLVLDLCLPRMDGMEVLRNLDGCLSKTSVLVVSGRSSLEERIKCFHLGADQLLTKPFSFLEFTACCKALGRRRLQIVDTALRHRGIELNRMARKVTREGESVELTGKEFALLEYLMQARGRCCTRTELLREVWQMLPDAGTNVVDVYVNYLRKKLAATKGGTSESGVNEAIETVRGSGYRMGLGQQKKPVQRSLPVDSAATRVNSASRLFEIVDGVSQTPEDRDLGARRSHVA